MSMIPNTVSFIDDRLNPIVVKELRQAVRSRFVTVVLLLYLIVEFFAVMMMILFNNQLTTDFHAGREVFLALQGILLGTCLLFISGYVGVRLAAERGDQNVDLVFITTIKPRSIVWGKVVAAIALTILIYSACAPFMVMTYLLRGIDIPSILVVLGLDLIVIAGGVFCALFIGALPTRAVTKVLLGIVLLIGMTWSFGMTMAGAFSMLYTGVGSRLDTWNFWGPALVVIAIAAAGYGLLLYMSGFMLTPPAANRARPVRIYVTIAWLLTGIIAFVVAATLPDAASFREAWVVVVMPILGAGILLSVSERDEWGQRMARTIPRRVWLRPIWLVFSSGALGGLIWACILIAITLGSLVLDIGGYGGGFSLMSFGAHARTAVSTGIPAYARHLFLGEADFACLVLAYCLTAVLIYDYLFRRKVKTSVIAPMALLMMGVGTILPIFIAFYASPNDWDKSQWQWMALNPIAGLAADNDGNRMFYFQIAWIWCVIVAILNIPWAWRQIRACRPPLPEPQTISTATTPTTADIEPITTPAMAVAAARDKSEG